MTIFNLPDLGEGLPDAEIHEWYVKAGDHVETDTPLVAMETAKALVDVPSPQTGIIKKLYGNIGDVIKTGAPLIEFENNNQTSSTNNESANTVVGSIPSTGQILKENFIIGANRNNQSQIIKATPAIRQLAKSKGLDIASITPTGLNGTITREDVEHAATTPPAGYEAIHSVRRLMSENMSRSHEEVVPVTIFDEADIYRWEPNEDITARLILAIITACHAEPALNAWFDGKTISRKMHNTVNLGIAIDTKDALYVPVIKQADTLSKSDLRNKINQFKKAVEIRSLSPADFQDATITLSNFGNFAGRFASPIVVPPMVAILGVGRLRQTLVPTEQGPAAHPFLPLSLSFDHRAVTGGEATRFLKAVITALESSTT